MSDQILQQEDTVSADRKVRIIFDPRTGKSRKITSVMHRQNFNNAKYGNRKDKGDEDENEGKDKDEKQVKEEKSQIKFVTGNETNATHVGQEKMKKDKVKKIAEAVIKKALNQISIDKNVGIKEIPTNESTNENATDMVNESTFDNASYSRIRSLVRKSMSESRNDDEDYAYETHKQREIDDKAHDEWKKKKKATTYQVMGSKNTKHGPEHKSLDDAIAHRSSLKGHPDHKNMGIHTINRVVESWEPEKEPKKPNDKVDAELKAAAKKNSAALDKISAAFAKKKVNEEAVLDELINEVLSADAAASDWIHDFVHSDNPKFAGKSKAKRKEMALAAYYSNQRNEEVELQEGDHDPFFTAQKHKKSADSAKKKGDNLAFHLHMADHHDDMAHWSQLRGRQHVSRQHLSKAEEHADYAKRLRKEEVELEEAYKNPDEHFAKQSKPMQDAINKHLRTGKSYWEAHRAAKVHVKEEVEQISELKKSTLGSYIQKASASAAEASNEAGFKAGVKQPKYNTSDDTSTEKKRAKGIATAVKKLTKEDVEQIDEISKKTLGSYVKKSAAEVQRHQINATTKALGSLTAAHAGKHPKTGESPIEWDNRKINNRQSGIVKAADRLTKEDVEQIDELSKATLGDYIKKANREAAGKVLTGATKGNNKDLVGASKDFGKAAKRNAGVNKAVDKLTKEGTDMSKLTFKQFVEQLDEMVEFVVTNEDVEQILEYTPGAGGVTRVQGKSYGASYHDPEGDDDADDKPAAKPAAAAAAPAKKGRGRPAGSYGSYKARSAETRAAAAAKSAASKAASKASN